MPRAEPPRCYRCWYPGRSDSCLVCYQHPPAYEGLRAAFSYTGAARKAVHSLKFDGLAAIAPVMAKEMALTFEAWDPPVDMIVPVPLDGMRRRTRGYNQAELLSRELSRLTGIPSDAGLVRRVRRTPSQVRQANAMARRRNVAGAFGAGRRAIGGGVLLVDDVCTTGATVDACSRALMENGADAVYCLVFARDD